MNILHHCLLSIPSLTLGKFLGEIGRFSSILLFTSSLSFFFEYSPLSTAVDIKSKQTFSRFLTSWDVKVIRKRLNFAGSSFASTLCEGGVLKIQEQVPVKHKLPSRRKTRLWGFCNVGSHVAWMRC